MLKGMLWEDWKHDQSKRRAIMKGGHESWLMTHEWMIWKCVGMIHHLVGCQDELTFEVYDILWDDFLFGLLPLGSNKYPSTMDS